MNPGFVYWLFIQQLEQQHDLARRQPAPALAQRRTTHWWTRSPRRRPLGHAVAAPRKPVGCAA